MAFCRVVLFTILVTLAKAGPLHPNDETKQNTCAIQCSNNNKFNYKLGNVYEFSYDAKTTTKMNGASKDAATINMNAKVEIEPVTKCDFVMKIKDASLRDSEGDQNSNTFKEALMKQPLKFSFQDGRIDHVCAMDGESIWTLNIKRGILSAFQNSMESFYINQNLTETDVVGTCNTEYKILSEGRTTMIMKKAKNLLGCSDREGYRLAVQSIGFNVPSWVKSLPLMKSEYRCTQTLDLGSNILKGSTCSEKHVFRPFSNEKNGAMTSSEQTLMFTNMRNGGHPSDEKFSLRSTLLFQHQNDKSSKQGGEEKIEAKLQELCQKAAEDIRPEVPEMFNQLIEHMRQVDRDVLSRIYRKINQKTFCVHKTNRIKQYFHDAIPMVGTAASVGMIQDLITRKHVTGSEAEMWLLSLSLAHHPTKEMVATAKPLLDERDVSGNTLLAVSSLASSYCNVQPNCGRDSEISALIRKLIDLTQGCNTQKADTRRIVFALRALGNIGHSHEAVSHLTSCSTRRDVPVEIRTAAMDAFRRVPCDAMRSDLMGVFRDESEDSELRLNAYIALMKCPKQNVLSEVRQVLETEKSNQVGSFVWTHLTNLMETSDPHMQDIRNIVQDEELKKEFNLDQRKFSRNYEGSFFLDSINTGAKVDSNVIFSEKSFIPRSANLNLTIDLFGQAINLLEFGGRVQGMEKILENFFGPTGVKEPKMKTKLPLDFDKSMDSFSGSAFLRVFGNELRYWDDKSLNELQSSLFKLMNMQAISFSKTMQLIDSRMIIPTCVGLPLSLTMSATGSISLDAKASFQQSKLELNVDFKPSASVQVKGEMSVDAHVSRAGLKMVTVAHTSTGAMLNIRNNKFDLQIPQKKMEIFNLKTDFYIIHRNIEKKQNIIFDNVKKQEICTGKLMKQVTGLTFCQAIKFPVVYDLYMKNEDIPNGYQIEAFSKKLPYSVYIDTPGSKTQRRIALKTAIKNTNEVEITLMAPWKNIQLEGAFINTRNLKKVSGKLFIAGRSNFAFNAQLGVKTMEDSLAYTPLLEITVPQKKLKYKGLIEMHHMKSFLINMEAKGFTKDDINLKVSGENLPENIGVSTQLKIRNKEYYVAGSLGKLVSKSGFKYTPFLKITIPNRNLVELTSEINYNSANRTSLQFTLKNEFSKIIHLNASLLHSANSTKSKMSLLFALKSPKGSCEIIGHTEIRKSLWINSATATYNFGDKYSDHLVLSSKFNDLSTMKATRLFTSINLKSESRSSLNFQVNGELSKSDNHLETKVDVHPGSLEDKTVNSFNFYSVAKKDLKQLSHIYNYAMSFQHPGQKINYKVEANHIQSAEWPFKTFENEVMVQMAPGKVVQTKLSYNNAKIKGLPTHESEVAISYPSRDMRLVDKLVQVNKNTYENHFAVQWQKGQKVTVQSTYTKTGKDIHNIENTLRLPNRKEAKATAMLQAMPGAYKTKVRFAVDENIISRQQINYKAEGSVSYTFNAEKISSDVIGEIMWAPNQKIAANINFNYMKKSSMSGKLAFSTPFDAMKNFDSEAKFSWANGKYTSMVFASNNNHNEFKQDFSFIYSDSHLSYEASALFSGKKSEISLAVKYSDMSLNGNMKISNDKTTIMNVTMKHNAQKMGFENEIGLDSDILDSNGKMKITLKYDKRNGEIVSSGEGKVNLQQFRQLGASYNFKHNNDFSSIDMSYSSSLRNGKMAIETRRNLPKMLKTKMELTHNGKPLFNMIADYGNQKDNIDMKIDITEPSGQKITVSGNINLSSCRKTGNLEFKSRYINFSADGNFKYKGTRSADGELKVKINGKNIMVSGNYNTDAAVDVSGILVLPDGRKIDGKLILKNKDGVHTSFVLNCPEFLLKHIDIGFTKIFDSVSSITKGHMQILPYFEKSKFEARLSTRVDTTFAIGITTPSVKFNQVQATMTLRKNSNTLQLMESEFWLNENKIIEMKLHTDIKNSNDILTSFELKTSHRRFDSVIVNFRHTGNSSDMKSSVDIKVGKETTFDMKLLNSDLHSEISLKTHLINFDDHEILLTWHRNLNNLQTTLNHTYGGKEGLQCEFLNSMNYPSINITVKYPEIINYDFYIDLNVEDMTSSVISNLATNGQVYELFVTYQHLKNLNMTVTIPSFNHELGVAFAEKSFKVRSNVIYNIQNYNAYLSIDEDFAKIDAQFNTPYSQNSVFLSNNGSIKNMNIDARIVHNGRTYKLIFSNIDYYHQLKSVLTSPSINLSIDFLLNGNSRNFNTALSIQFNNRPYEMKASNTEYIRNMNFMLNTPACKCDLRFVKEANNIDGTFSASIGGEQFTFELKKEADFEISLRLSTYFEIRIVCMGNTNSSVLDAHFKAMPYLDECLLEARFLNKGAPILDFVLKTPLDRLKNVNATVSFGRNSNLAHELKLVCSVNDQTLVEMKCAYNIGSIANFTASLGIKTPHHRFDEIEVDLKYFRQNIQIDSSVKAKFGREINFEVKIQNTDKMSEMSLKGRLGDYDAWETLMTRSGLQDNMTATLSQKIGGRELFSGKLYIEIRDSSFNIKIKSSVVNFEFESRVDPENIYFDLHSSLELQKKEVCKIVATYKHMTKLHVRTSLLFYNGELTMRFNENREVFNASFKAMPYFDTMQIEVKFTRKQFSIETKTRFESMEQAKFAVMLGGDWVRSQNIKAIIQLNNEQIVELGINYNFKSISDFIVNMTVITPHRHYKEFLFDLKNEGSLRDMQLSLKFKLTNLFIFDVMLHNSRRVNRISLGIQLLDFDVGKSTFELKDLLDYMTANIITSTAKKEVNRIDVSLEEYGRSVNFKIKSPKVIKFDFNINLDPEAITFNMASAFTLNDRKKIEMSASYEHLSKLQIKTFIPYYKDELLITFSGNLKSFNVQSKFNHNNQMYELMFSNKDYYRQVKGNLNTPYFKDTASFSFDGEFSEMNILAQFVHNEDKFELTFANKGYYQQIDAKLGIPYFQPMIQFSLTGIPQKFNFELRIHLSKLIYEMKASSENYFRQMNFLIYTPKLNCNFRLNKTGGSLYLSYANANSQLNTKRGDDFGFNLHSNLDLQREEIYKIIATYEDFTKLYIKTSFSSYNDELTMSLNGDQKMFNALAKFTHNKSKYELNISNQGYYRKVDAQLITPFFTDVASFTFDGDENTFTAQAKFMHEIDQYELVVSKRNHYEQMSIILSTPFSRDKLNIDFEGDLSSFESVVIFSHNKVEHKLQVSNEGYYRKMNAKLTTPSFEMETLFNLDGSFKDFNLHAEFSCCHRLYKLNIENIEYYQSINVELNTPYIQTEGLFKYNGDPEAFNLTAIFNCNDKKYELTMANAGYYQEINATLSTPFSSQSAMFNMKGQWGNFTLEASVAHNQYTYNLGVYNLGFSQNMSASVSIPSLKTHASFAVGENLDSFKFMSHLTYDEQHYQLSVTSLRNNRNMECKVKTPSFTTEASFNLIREERLFLTVAKLSHNDKLYRLSVGNPDDNSTFSAELITPAFETDAIFTVDKQDTLTFVSRITYDKKEYQLIFSTTDYYRNIKAKMATPLTKTEAFVSFNGDLRDFNLMTQIAFNGKHYGLNIANSDIYRKIWTKLVTPQCTCSFLFNLKGNLESFNSQATFTHNNTQYKLSLSNKHYYEQINIGLSTPHFHKSFMVTLNGDLKAFNIKAAFNNNKDQYELMVSNKNYYQLISIKLTTPFSKDSVSFSFNGNWSQFSSKIKVMYQKDQYEFVINMHHFEMWASLTTPSIRETATFSLKGKSHAFNISMSFSHNNSDYKLLVSAVRYYQRINIEIFTPLFSSKVISNSENQLKALKFRGSLMHATQWHEVVISNSGYYRSLEIKLTSSSFTNTSLSYDLIGDLKTFTLQTKFTHDHDEYNLAVSNEDFFRHMGAHLSTPYLKNSFSFHLNGEFKTFELRSTFKHNTELYEFAFSNKNYFGQISSHLITPYLKNSFLFRLNGEFKTFDLKAIFKHNTGQCELLVSNKNYFRHMSATLVTPHLNNSFSFDLNGDFNTFDLNATFNHHTKQYELLVSNKDYFRQISAYFTTPYVKRSFSFYLNGDLNSFDLKAKLKHNIDQYDFSVSNNNHFRQISANLSTPNVKESFSFYLNGDFNTFDLKTTLEHNTDQYEFSVSNDNYYRQVGANISTPYLKDSFSFNLNGDMKTFGLKATIKHNIDQYEFTVLNRGYYQQITTNLKTPVSEDSISFSLNGSLTNFTLKIYAQYNKNPYEVIISSSGYYREFDANLTSPFLKCSTMFSLKGHLESFQFLVISAYNADKYQLQISNRGFFENISAELIIHPLHTFEHIQKTSKYQFTFFNNRFPHQMGLQILTPQFEESINFTYAGNIEKFNAVFTAKHSDKIYSIKMSNRDIYHQMNFQMNTPYIVCDFKFDVSKENDNVVIQIKIGKARCELSFSGNTYSKIGEFRLSNSLYRLHIKSNIYHKKSSVTGDVTAFLNKHKFVLNGDYKRFGQRESVKIYLKTPYFYDRFQGSIAGTLKKFDAIMKFQHNKDAYEMKASNKDYYNALDLSLKTPLMKANFNSVSNLHNFKVSAVLKLTTGYYELVLSNQNHLQNIHMEMNSPQSGNILFAYDLQGELNNFNLTSQFSHMKNTYELNVLRDIETGERRLTIVSPQMNINVPFNGDSKSFSFDVIAIFKKQKYEIFTSMKNYFREISGKLTTPQFGEQSLSMKINGQMTDFNGYIEVKNGNRVYRSEFSLENNQFQLSLPKWMNKLQVKLIGNWKNFDFSIAVKNNNEVYRCKFSLKNQEFKGSLHLPGLQEKLHVKFPSCRENIDIFIQLLHNGKTYEMSFTKTKSMKSHIIISQWGTMNVSVNGDLKNSQIKMKVIFEKNIFENTAEIRFDGSRLDIDAKILYEILGQSGQFDMQLSNIPDNKLFKSELRVNAGDIELIASSSVEYSPQMNAVFLLNSPTFDNSTMQLRVVAEGFHKIDAILNLKTPWKKVYKMFYQHNIDSEYNLSSKAYIKRDEIRLAGYSVLATFNSSYIFNFKCDYNNYSHKLLVKGDLKFQEPVSVANLRIDTSFGSLKELYISTKMSQESLNSRLNLRQKKQQIGLKFDKSSYGISLSAKVNTLQNRQYQLQISNKHTDVSQTLKIKIVHPIRTTEANYNFENTEHSKVVTSDLIWDEARDQKIGFELVVQKDKQNESKLRIITPLRTVEIFGKVVVNGNRYSTVGHIMLDENNQAQKVDIIADVMISSGRADIDLTIKFPNKIKGMNLKTSINLPNGDLIFSSNFEFSMDQDPKKSLKMSTKLMSETKGKRQMYTLQMNSGHAQSGFATELVGRVSSSAEKYNADVEMGYLTMKGKQQKFAIRGEVHRFNREVNLKLESPSKIIELDGSLTTGNRYIISFLKKETGKEIMEALIKLSPNAQRINIIFNYDEEYPDKVYRFDAEIMESKIFFKAHRAGKGSNSTDDAAFYAELNPHSILKSSIRWNPNLFQEFNVFGNQKLQMYGRQLKNLEESFRNVFNDEVFEKIVSVKNSFGEDLSSFSDNFLTEFATLSQDFGKVWHEFKEMYQRNYFYLKSGTETVHHVCEYLWSNYQEKMVLIRMTVENYYKIMTATIGEEIKKIDLKYAHYEAVFMKKSSEIFAYCRIQNSIFYKNAMKMQADIYKTIERHRSIIKEIIEVIRQNPYGEMAIDFLVEMYEGANEKTVQTRKHVETLTSAIYSAYATLNHHIVSARRYSIVDAIVNVANKVYQQALTSYNYLDVKDDMLGLRDTLYKFGAEKIREIKNIITDIGMNTLVFDPKSGEITVEIHFGAAKYFYNHFMSSVEDINRAMMKLKNLVPILDIWDIYYMMKPSTDIDDYIYPFKAEATLFAGQHITTFDGRQLIYKGTCSYLLARDFIDGNFTIVANFGANHRAKTLKSINITTAHNEQLEIFPNNKVLFNGRVAKLPLQLTDATVTLQGNVIVVESKRGYKVMCDHHLQLYTVQISGWYFNKVAGLFGNFNNEPKDDMLMSNNSYTNDLEQFAQSWSVSRQCQSHRNTGSSHMIQESRECAYFFLQTDSPLRYCFRQVNPNNFYKICATQMTFDRNISRDLCKVTSFYIEKCERKGVFLQQPVICKTVTDKIQNRSLLM